MHFLRQSQKMFGFFSSRIFISAGCNQNGLPEMLLYGLRACGMRIIEIILQLSLSVKSQSHKQHFFLADTKANAKETKRDVF